MAIAKRNVIEYVFSFELLVVYPSLHPEGIQKESLPPAHENPYSTQWIIERRQSMCLYCRSNGQVNGVGCCQPPIYESKDLQLSNMLLCMFCRALSVKGDARMN